MAGHSSQIKSKPPQNERSILGLPDFIQWMETWKEGLAGHGDGIKEDQLNTFITNFEQCSMYNVCTCICSLTEKYKLGPEPDMTII